MQDLEATSNLLQPTPPERTEGGPFVRNIEGEWIDLSQPVPSRIGSEFIPSEDRWSEGFADQNMHNIDWNAMEHFTELFINRVKYVLSDKAETQSAGSLLQIFHSLTNADISWSSLEKIDRIEEADIYCFLDSFDTAKTAQAHGINLRFLANYSEAMLPKEDALFSQGAMDLLKDIKKTKRETGFYLDDEKGRFDDKSLSVLAAKIQQAFDNKTISEEIYTVYVLGMAFGFRPEQFCQLKVCDFRHETDQHGNITYYLDIPYVKNRKRPRYEFQSFMLDDVLAAFIQSHIVSLPDQSQEAPLFPCRLSEDDVDKPTWVRQDGILKGHSTVVGFSRHYKIVRKALGVPFSLNMYRLRYTVATRHLRVMSESQAAILMTHKTTESMKHYGDKVAYEKHLDGLFRQINGDKPFDLLDKAKALNLWQGVITEALEKGSVRLRDASIAPESNGACSGPSGCKKDMPYACYNCKSMRARSNGPHEAYLLHTIELYKTRIANGDNEGALTLLAPIFGMAKVIYLIREMKESANG